MSSSRSWLSDIRSPVRLILRRQQQRHDIPVVATITPPSLDQVGHHAIERRSRRAESPHVRQRKQIGERRERQDGNFEKTRRRLQRIADFGGDGVPFGTEQDARRDRQREAAHFARDIDGVSVAPPVALLDAERRHDAGIFVQPHAMKDRLNKPALAACSAPSLVSSPLPKSRRAPLNDRPLTNRCWCVTSTCSMSSG